LPTVPKKVRWAGVLPTHLTFSDSILTWAPFFGAQVKAHAGSKIIPMKHTALIAGDILALAFVTLIGFATHCEFAASYLPRMAASLLPLLIGWFLLAPSLGLFEMRSTTVVSELWRPPFVMLFAGPFAALVRGIALAAPVIPSFAVVLTLTGAVALTLWRGLYMLLHRAAAA
jgi:DUF3054 family protein